MEDFVQISLDAFARIQARADSGMPLGELLAGEGLSGDAWLAAKKGWLGLIGSDVQRGDYRLSQKYQRAYLTERPELVEAPEPAAAETPAEASPRQAPSPALAAAPVAAPASVAEPPPPAGIADPGMQKPVSVSLTGEPMTLKGDVRVDFKQLLPFQGKAEAPPSAAAELETETKPVMGQTLLGEVNSADLGLPFRPKPKASSAPSPPSPPSPTPPPSVPLAPPLSAPSAPPPSAPPAVPPAKEEPPAFGNMTLDPSQVVMSGDLLPFKGKAAPPKSALDDLEPVSPRDIGRTLDAGLNIADVAPSLVIRPETSSTKAADEGPPPVELTVDQYAAYCAEQRIWPDAAETRRRRYGLTSPEAVQQLEAHWRVRYDREPALRRQLDELIERWEASYRNQS